MESLSTTETATSKNIPQLRFPEFDDEWIEKKTIDIAHLQRGFDLPNRYISKGKYPVVHSKGITKYHNEYKVKGPGVVTGRSGTIGYVNYVKSDFWPHNTTLWVTNFHKNHPKFIYYFLKIFKLERINSGSTVPTLNRNDVHSIKKNIPKLPEQQKIANFLTQVDKKIELLEEKQAALEQYKKGVMQKIFNREIRFQIENEAGERIQPPEWEEKKLGDIGFFKTSSVDKKIDERQNSVFLVNYMDVYKHKTISNEAIKYFNKITANKNQIDTFNLKKGDILFTPSSETSDDIGHSVVIFEDIKNTVYSYHLMRFRPSVKIDIIYSHYFCNTPFVLRQLSRLATGSTRFTISKGNFSTVKVHLPCLEEQRKIADFLSAIDTKIGALAERSRSHREWKKGLLQKMFV